MMYHKSKLLTVAFFVFFYGLTTLCLAANLTMQLSQDQVALGGSVVLTYTMDNDDNNNEPDFSVLEKDFFIMNRNYGSTIQTINGTTTNQRFWRFVVMPKKTGTLFVPEVNFGHSKTMARQLIVTENQSNSEDKNQNLPVFVSAEIGLASPYVQSQTVYTLKVFFRTQIHDARIEIPQDKDLSFHQLENDQTYQTIINNQPYHVIEKKFAVFPKKPGTITISPMRFQAITIDDNNNSTNGFFDIYTPRPISTVTKSMALSVRDVPPNFKGPTWLPAQQLSLREEWSRTNSQWEAGTPVTRTITIEANGLPAEQLPGFSFDKMDGVNVYVERAKRHNEARGNTLVGTFEQKVTYIPSNDVQFITLPPVVINWWNTKTNSNAVSELPGKTISIKNLPAQSTVPQSPQKTVPVKKMLSPLSSSKMARPIYLSMWFSLVCVFLLIGVIMICLLLLRKKQTNVKENVPKILEQTDHYFKDVCISGEAIKAQQFILTWAKKHWPNTPLNLTALKTLISDHTFQLAIEELEQAIYAKKEVAWCGRSLFTAYCKVKKSSKNFSVSGLNAESKHSPLPPLNP